MVLPYPEDDVMKVLEEYGLGDIKGIEHLSWGLQNTNFRVDTSEGSYVLKIIESKTLDQLHSQIEIMDSLKKQGVRVPGMLQAPRGMVSFKGKPTAMFEFLQGSHPEKITTGLCRNLVREVIKLQKGLLPMNPRVAPMERWADDLSVEENHLNENPKTEYLMAFEDLKKRVQRIDCSKLRKGCIHGDLTKVNYLVDGDEVLAFLDFDDVRKDYLVHDLAIFAAHTCFFEKKIDDSLATVFLEEYGLHDHLNDEERNSLVVFIMRRFLSSTLFFEHLLYQGKGDKNRIEGLRDEFWGRYVDFIKRDFGIFGSLLKN